MSSYLFWAYLGMLSLETSRKGPSFCDNMEAVPKRMARAERVPTGLAVRKRSKAEPDLPCVPGLTTPEIGRPVEVRGLELYIFMLLLLLKQITISIKSNYFKYF